MSTDPTPQTEPDNPAAYALARHIADHPVSTIQAAFRYLNAPLTIEVHEVLDDTDLTEADVDRMMAAGTPVQIVTTPPDTRAAGCVVSAAPTQADDRAARRERYAAAIRAAGDTAYGNRPFYEAITDAVIALANAELAARRAADLRDAEEICDEAGASYTAKALNDHAAGAYELMERFRRKAEEAEQTAAAVPVPPTTHATDLAATCICGHTEQQHFEDVCITEITGCDCGDYLVPEAAREVIARWREAAGKAERIRENADFHLGQEMARRQLAEKEADRLRAELRRMADEAQQPECSPACSEQHTYSRGCALATAEAQQQPDTETPDRLARVREWVTSDVVTARSEFGNGYREAQRDIRDLVGPARVADEGQPEVLTPCTCRQTIHAQEHKGRTIPDCPWCTPDPDIRPKPGAETVPTGDAL